MKKLSFFIFSFAMLCSGAAAAQETSVQDVDSLQRVVRDLNDQVRAAEAAVRDRAIWNDRAKFFNLGYVSQKLTPMDVSGDLSWKSDMGFSLVWGRTWYLHRKPLARMIKFGIDFAWMDMNYAKYSIPEATFEGSEYGEPELDLGAHQYEYGIQVGPSITINPVSRLKISAYFHVVPSASLMVLNDEVNAGYATFFNAGGAVSFNVISIGVEGRWGRATYNNFSLGSLDEQADYFENGMSGDPTDVIETGKAKFKTGSVRVYVSFRF